jgi:hypothetical protein
VATVNAGTVSFLDGSTVLGTSNVNSSGTATFQTSTLAAGSHTLTARYNGSTSFNASTSSTMNVSVTAAIATSLSVGYSTSYANQPWTVNATIGGSLLANTPRTGTLTLTEGSNTLASLNLATATLNSAGQYTLAAAGLPDGQNTVKVSYSGDAHYGASSATFTVTVHDDALYMSYQSTALAGQPYTMSAMVNGPTVKTTPPTGTLSLMEGTATLASVNLATATPSSSGYYSVVDAAGLSLGTHTLSVAYSGDGNYDALTANMGTITSATAATATSISGPTTASFGQSLTYTAYVYPSGVVATVNAGTVSFLDGSTVLGTSNVNSSGTATFQTSTLAAGSHTLTARYNGSTSFNASTSSTMSVNVIGGVATSLGSTANAALSSTASSSVEAVSTICIQSTGQTVTPCAATMSPLAVDQILSTAAEEAAKPAVASDGLDVLTESISGGMLT